jgi:molybdenum cofactor synthesis domain-containing protein
MSTAGILIIGNEILSGKITDVNTAFLCKELYDIGVEVCRVVIIPDVLEEIAKEVLEMSDAYDYVFTSGGVGPTHDDMTVEGVAKAFGLELEECAEIVHILERYQKPPLNSSQLKMALLPVGATLMGDSEALFPVTVVRNVHLFPGIPSLLQRDFDYVRPHLSGRRFFQRRIYLSCYETVVAEELGTIQSEFSEIRLGSYPRTGQEEHKVMLTLESRDLDQVRLVYEALLKRLPDEVVMKTDVAAEEE